MILSMTGYGKDTVAISNFSLETEIKSLNSRYLDLSVKLPKELNNYEFDIRDLIKKNIIRGKISLQINLYYDEGNFSEPKLNKNSLAKTIEYLEEIKKFTKNDEKISLSHLISLKEHYFVESEEIVSVEWEALKSSIVRALQLLTEMRSREGEFLKKDIEARLSEISKNLSRIEETAQTSTVEYYEKFKEKAKKLADDFIDDHERFLIELGILSEKHDVTEECTRLRSHIKIFNEAINNSTDIGRRLNFICQEMNREINTINSKSVSSDISHLGINIKEELEKIREQVQNIE